MSLLCKGERVVKTWELISTLNCVNHEDRERTINRHAGDK